MLRAFYFVDTHRSPMFQGGKAVSKYPGVHVKTSTSVIPGGDPESSRIPIKYDKSFNAEGRRVHHKELSQGFAGET